MTKFSAEIWRIEGFFPTGKRETCDSPEAQVDMERWLKKLRKYGIVMRSDFPAEAVEVE